MADSIIRVAAAYHQTVTLKPRQRFEVHELNVGVEIGKQVEPAATSLGSCYRESLANRSDVT